MSQYERLDAMILLAIDSARHPLYFGPCTAEGMRIAEATGRESFRVIDGRLQALRRAGKIDHLVRVAGRGGWRRVDEPSGVAKKPKP